MKRVISLLLVLILAFSFVSSTQLVNASGKIIYGDLNDDTFIDMKDMLVIRLHLARILGKSEFNSANADINSDGKINAVDAMMIIRHIAKEKEIVQSNIYSISAFKDSINLYGRAQYSEDDTILLSQTASGFDFISDCEGNIEIYMNTAANGKLNITVDGDYENSYEVDVSSRKSKYVVQTDLAYGQHYFLIQKATEHGQNDLFEITGVSVGGEVGQKKRIPSQFRIEFYGDSLTAGYGNLTSNGTSGAGTWQYQNGCKTYATFASQKLGADYAIAAASGHGVMYGYGEKEVGKSTTDKYWDYTLVGDKTPWSRTDYDADLIVINFGTNDNSTDNMYTDVTIDKDEYKAKVKTLVETMKDENPDVEILWVLGMAYISESSTVVKAIKEVDAELDYLNFYFAPARTNGGDGHPSVADHKYHAENLVNKIKELYPDMSK